MKTVVVGMSGGIDSSFAAYYLLEKGYDVIGVTMLGSPNKNEIGKCCSLEDINDAKLICKKLGIKHYVVDLTKEFKNKIINYFIESYLKGETPNPCIRCNKLIKFGLLYDWAILKFKADYFATGHYAKIKKIKNNYFLSKAKDISKDQSYFLYQIDKKKLPNIIFPCGDFTKSEIKEKIVINNLLNLERKKESFDVCFVPGNDYKKFIKENIDESLIKKGYFLNEKGEKILFKGKPKENDGILYYTIGQRKGIGFSIGKKAYVRDIKNNGDVVIGDRPLIKGVSLIDINLFEDMEKFPEKFHIKLRYNHKGTIGFIKKVITEKDLEKDYKNKNVKTFENFETEKNNEKYMNKIINRNKVIKEIIIEFDKPVDASSKGQSGVIYNNDIILGGGIINKLYFI